MWRCTYVSVLAAVAGTENKHCLSTIVFDDDAHNSSLVRAVVGIHFTQNLVNKAHAKVLYLSSISDDPFVAELIEFRDVFKQ